MPLIVSPDLADIVRAGVIWFEGVTVVDREPRLDAPLAAAESQVRAQSGAGAGFPGLSRVEGSRPEDMEAVRTMYKRVGIDPTKRRPSSEALLRRVRKGEPLPRINSCVDVCNWCSLEFQLPYGLYDSGRIDGDRVELRIGREGESYPGIRKDDVHVGGRIALVDATGPFGNPTSDSARTMVTTSTTGVMLVVFAPHDTSVARLGTVMNVTAARMVECVGGHEVARDPAKM